MSGGLNMRIGLLFLIGFAAFAQDSPDHIVVPFSDASRARMLKVNLLQGSIAVRGYAGKDAIIDSHGTARHSNSKRPDGLRRLDINPGLSIEEQENVVYVKVNAWDHADLSIQVPYNTSLQLKATNGGTIAVDSIEGELDVDIVNGTVRLNNISGPVVAHALNGEVRAELSKVTAGKPMSFSSLNGDVDVTLPRETKANVRMKSDHGEVYSDFDVRLTPNVKTTVEETNSERGKHRIRVDGAVSGTINGGGSDISMTTLNGNIYLRQKK